MEMKNKNKIIIGSIAFAIFIFWMACFKLISPGYTGIIVNLFGDEKGTSPKELGVGMHWISPWKTVYEFPMFEQNHVWDGDKSFTFQTGEGLRVNADIGLSYHLEPGKIHTLFAKYRRGMDEITDLFVRNYARDAINKASSKMKAEDLYGVGKQAFMEAVQNELKVDLAPMGISIDRVYLIGTIHFPEQVVKALNSKIEATQRAQQRENELREARAQAEKEVAAAQGKATSKMLEAQAEADSNILVAKSLTQNLLMYEAVKQWDGKMPQVFTDKAIPMFELKADKNKE